MHLQVNVDKLKERVKSPLKKLSPRSGSSDEEIDEEAWKKPKSHHGAFGFFDNPWPSARAQKAKDKIPDSMPVEREKPVPENARRIKVVKPTFNKQLNPNELQTTWLGHAGVLIQLPRFKEDVRPVTLLIDPIFAERAFPTDKAGPSRSLDPPCEVEDLPDVDFLFISHNHFDHLDGYTLRKLFKSQPSTIRYIVPINVGEWFEDEGIPKEQILEMDWWEDHTFNEDFLTHGLGSIQITCVPAQHESARTGVDKKHALWAGYVIEQFATKDTDTIAPVRTAVYFAGDTGYRSHKEGPTCPIFKQIGERFGALDFAAIPIWRGGTLSFISSIGLRLDPDAVTLTMHAPPDDAVCIHKDVRSRATMGIHFATFAGSEDEATYPIMLLEEACKEARIPNEIGRNGFGVCDIGETLTIPVDGKPAGQNIDIPEEEMPDDASG